jgi:ubiquinone/menaquinone biosynthesis C-methylase UbiE
MKVAEYTRMAKWEETYWWHLGRLRIIETYLRHALKKRKSVKGDPKILNVGCGTGGTIDALEKLGEVDNVDISDDAIRFMKQRGYERITKVNGIALPFRDKAYDIVGGFDVLEHIEEHEDALREWKRVLKDDGAIVITVPAYQWLWSDHDVSLFHKRRYTTILLESVAKNAGLKVEKKSYAIVFSLPLVVGFRTLNKLTGRKVDSETSYVDVPKWVNGLFTQFLYQEATMHRVLSFPMGTTVIATLRKDT